jgi:hypothetical protein
MNALVQLWYRFKVVCSLFGPRWNLNEWSAEDSQTLATFLETSTGKKLTASLRNLALESCVRACHSNSSDLQVAAGYAKGQQGMFAMIMNFSASGPPLTPQGYGDVLRAQERNGDVTSHYYAPAEDEEVL